MSGRLGKMCLQPLLNLSLQPLPGMKEIVRSAFGSLKMGCLQKLSVHSGPLAAVDIAVAS